MDAPDGPDRVVVDRAVAAYGKAFLPVAWHKGFGFAAPPSEAKRRAASHFTYWGSDIDGIVGTSSAPEVKRACLAGLSAKNWLIQGEAILMEGG